MLKTLIQIHSLHKIIHVHQKPLSKKCHHENNPKVLIKGFQPSHTDTLQLLLFPVYQTFHLFFQFDGTVCKYSVYVVIH